PTLFDNVIINSGLNSPIQLPKDQTAGLCRNLTLTNGYAIAGRGELYINGDADLTGYSGLISNIYFIGSGLHVFTPDASTVLGIVSPIIFNLINFSGVGTYTINSDLVTSSQIVHN